MPIKKTVELKTGRLSENAVRRLRNLVERLYGVATRELIPENLYYTCFDNLCIIYTTTRDSLEGINFTRLFAGKWIGVYHKKILAPSISLVKEIYGKVGVKAALVVNDKGVKAFLYGNDVLPESVVQVVPPKRGLFAVIDQSDGEVIGFARWNPRKEVYENVYDLGLYLRLLG